MTVEIEKTEGRVKVLGYELFYRVFTPPAPRSTLVCLHGGPGATHDYLLPLRDLAESG
jgi:pimeloyl-ACP methyl ester carboxylesterase